MYFTKYSIPMRIYLILILVLFTEYSFSVNNNFTVNKTTHTTENINTVANFTNNYKKYKANNKPDSILLYADLLIEQYKNTNDTIAALKTYNETCDFLLNSRQYNFVAIFLNQYVQYAEETGAESHIAKAYLLIGNFFLYASIDKEIALEYYMKSLKICENCKLNYYLVLVYKQLGYYYTYPTHDYNLALDYFFKSIKISSEFEYYTQYI